MSTSSETREAHKWLEENAPCTPHEKSLRRRPLLLRGFQRQGPSVASLKDGGRQTARHLMRRQCRLEQPLETPLDRASTTRPNTTVFRRAQEAATSRISHFWDSTLKNYELQPCSPSFCCRNPSAVAESQTIRYGGPAQQSENQVVSPF